MAKPFNEQRFSPHPKHNVPSTSTRYKVTCTDTECLRDLYWSLPSREKQIERLAPDSKTAQTSLGKTSSLALPRWSSFLFVQRFTTMPHKVTMSLFYKRGKLSIYWRRAPRMTGGRQRKGRQVKTKMSPWAWYRTITWQRWVMPAERLDVQCRQRQIWSLHLFTWGWAVDGC